MGSSDHKEKDEQKTDEILRNKDADNHQNGQADLHTRIEAVNDRINRIVLTQGDIVQHPLASFHKRIRCSWSSSCV